MEQYFESLKTCPLFDGIGQSELPGMLNCIEAHVSAYIKNQTILREGDPVGTVGIVLSGRIQVEKNDYNGNRTLLARLEPPELFGEAFACAGVQRLPVSVTSVQDSEVMLIPCKRMITACANCCAFHTRVIHNLLHIVAEKNLMLNQKIEVISKRTTKEKLMAFLLVQAKQHNSRMFSIPYDRQALADYLGVERSAMSAELGRLRREGKIDFYKNQFKLL